MLPCGHPFKNFFVDIARVLPTSFDKCVIKTARKTSKVQKAFAQIFTSLKEASKYATQGVSHVHTGTMSPSAPIKEQRETQNDGVAVDVVSKKNDVIKDEKEAVPPTGTGTEKVEKNHPVVATPCGTCEDGESHNDASIISKTDLIYKGPGQGVAGNTLPNVEDAKSVQNEDRQKAAIPSNFRNGEENQVDPSFITDTDSTDKTSNEDVPSNLQDSRKVERKDRLAHTTSSTSGKGEIQNEVSKFCKMDSLNQGTIKDDQQKKEQELEQSDTNRTKKEKSGTEHGSFKFEKDESICEEEAVTQATITTNGVESIKVSEDMEKDAKFFELLALGKTDELVHTPSCTHEREEGSNWKFDEQEQRELRVQDPIENVLAISDGEANKENVSIDGPPGFNNGNTDVPACNGDKGLAKKLFFDGQDTRTETNAQIMKLKETKVDYPRVDSLLNASDHTDSSTVDQDDYDDIMNDLKRAHAERLDTSDAFDKMEAGMASKVGEKNKNGNGNGVNVKGENPTAKTPTCFGGNLQLQTNNDEIMKIGERIEVNGYRVDVLDTLGSGGFSSVYSGIDSFGRAVALKAQSIVGLASETINRIKEEIEIHEHMNHPNIIQVYGVKYEAKRIIIIMEKAEGGTLRGILREVNYLDTECAKKIVVQVASALSHIHKMGLVHSDIKPDNILVKRDILLYELHNGFINDIGHVWISDFGLAVPIGASMDGGTQNYLPLEYKRRKHLNGFGDSDVETGGYAETSMDMWSLGLVFRDMITPRFLLMLTDDEKTVRPSAEQIVRYVNNP